MMIKKDMTAINRYLEILLRHRPDTTLGLIGPDFMSYLKYMDSAIEILMKHGSTRHDAEIAFLEGIDKEMLENDKEG